MSSIVLLVIGVTAFVTGYRIYSRYIARRIYQLDPDFVTPAHEFEDGVDFRWVWTRPYARNDWRRFANWWSFLTGVPAAARGLDGTAAVIGSSPHLLAALAAKRAEAADGPWVVVAEGFHDAEVANEARVSDPSAADGATYYYRIVSTEDGIE